jgi:hypothetical protein
MRRSLLLVNLGKTRQENHESVAFFKTKVPMDTEIGASISLPASYVGSVETMALSDMPAFIEGV